MVKITSGQLRALMEHGDSFKFVETPEALNLDQTDFENNPLFKGNIDVTVRVDRVQDDFYVKLAAKTSVHLLCDRCLAGIDVKVSAEYSVVFAPETSPGSPGPTTFTAGDYRTLKHNDDVILDDVVREAVLLELPNKALCREDCQGFCSNCGADLNKEKCSCQDLKIDPRLEKLIEIKKQLKE